MTKQRFPLQSVLKLHQADRDQQQHQFSAACMAEEAVVDTASDLHDQLQQVQSLLRRALTPGEIVMDEVRSLQAEERTLRVRLKEIRQQHLAMSARTEEEREALSKVNCEVRVIEAMADRRRQTQMQERSRQETRETDDCGTRTTFRKSR